MTFSKIYFTFDKKYQIMKNTLLLPNSYKTIGWFVLIPATILGILLTTTNFNELEINTKVFAIFNSEFLGKSQSFSFIHTNITSTLVGIMFIIGALIVSFSKEKLEDEFIADLRHSSLLWAVYVNYILLLLAFAFIYGGAFLNVMVYNMFTILIIFIIRFHFILYRNTKSMSDEK